MSYKIEKTLRRIYAKPLYAAVFVGLIIHFLQAFNFYIHSGTYYLAGDYKENHPIQIIIEILIPFLVPLVVISYGRRVSRFNERMVMSQFPDLNPDIVIKTNLDADIEYLNPTALALLDKTRGQYSNPADLLPDQFKETINHIVASNKSQLALEHHLDDQTIEYTINCSPKIDSVFVSGRNISQRRIVEQRLHDSQNLLREMSDMLDKIFEDYDPLNFNLDEHFKQIVGIFLKPASNGNAAKPTHVLLASQRQGSSFVGKIYTLQDNEIIVCRQNLEIDWNTQNGFCAIQKDVYFFNQEDSGETTQEFQHRFTHEIQDVIGGIERYATFRSGHIGVMAVYQGDRITQFEAIVLKSLAIYSNALLRISLENKATEDAFIYAIEALARASEINDEDTGSHITRINEYCRVLARELGQSEDFIKTIHYAAQMHDVGKIHTPAEILKKPGRLSDEEFRTMQQHTIAGARILGSSPRLQMAAEIARSHHEKWDGSGYPDGLVAEEIPLSARIVAVADVYDALRQKRVYKEAMSHNEAMHILTYGDERTSPAHFDPLVLAALERVQDKMDEIYSRFIS